jgi:hypothetical protein
LLSRITNFDQEANDDYWNFNEADTQDPLVEKYFGSEQQSTQKVEMQDVQAEALPPVPDTKMNSAHQRTESQSSAGLSVGTSSILDSELDIAGSIEGSLTGSLGRVQLEDASHQRPCRTASMLSISIKEQQPEASEDNGTVRIFPKLQFKPISRAEWSRARQLLFKIKDLEEMIASPFPVLPWEDRQAHLKERQGKLTELYQLIEEAESIVNSKVQN